MSDPAPILVYGSDLSLLETRRMVLKTPGGEVYTATKPAEAEQILLHAKPNLLVLCYTLSSEDRRSILDFARGIHPAMTILVLEADRPAGAETAQETFNIFSGPDALKKKVRELLAAGTSRQQRTR